jgi:hypothetical protein
VSAESNPKKHCDGIAWTWDRWTKRLCERRHPLVF